MPRLFSALFVAVVCAVAPWGAPQALAQAANNPTTEQQHAAEFTRLYERWRQARDPEDRIRLGEQALAMEPTLPHWPMKASRERFKGQISRGLGYAYHVRRQGVRADNLEKAIAGYEAALTAYSQQAFPKDWAWIQHNLGRAYSSRIHGDHADNLEKSIARYQAALRVRTREAFPKEWADIQHDLSTAFGLRVRGERAENLENSIAHSEAALTVRTRDASPREWADSQRNLGDAYELRVRGERADNLEKAIACYEAALTVLTRESVPTEWAKTNNSLGYIFWRRVNGERAENVEKAITHYEAALTMSTRTAFPKQWSETQHNLGLAYGARSRGERAGNLAKSIAHYEATLTVMTREASPRVWAQTNDNLALAYLAQTGSELAENIEKAIAHLEAALPVIAQEPVSRWLAVIHTSLGTAYGRRIRGVPSDNLEKSIAHEETALTLLTLESFPKEWAAAHHNLGVSYRSRIRGNAADNIEKSIAHYEAALTVRTRVDAPADWARTQNNLGVAYFKRRRGDWADNLEKAIAHYTAAQTARSREALPSEWAETENNLGVVYADRVLGERADNMEKAIGHYEAALMVRTLEADRHAWAQTQYNLGIGYWRRRHGEYADNLQKSVAHYRAALTVSTPGASPRAHLQTARNLGRVSLQMGDWSGAGTAYAAARESYLLLFGEGLEDAEARDLIAETNELFPEAAFAAIERGESAAALGLSVEGRARQLAVALKPQTLDLSVDKLGRLNELRTAIRTVGRGVEDAQGAERATNLEKLVGLRQELLTLIRSASPIQGRAQAALAQARALIGTGGAIIVPVVTWLGTKILIVMAPRAGDDGIAVLDLPDLTSLAIDQLVRGSERGKTGGWLGAYEINYLPLHELEQRWPEWLAAIDELGPKLWQMGGDRLGAALKAAGVGPGARLFWLPSGALGIVPIGLAQDPVSKRRLAEEFEISYAPSLDALTIAHDLVDRPAQPSLAAVINPTGDLPGTEKEGAIVASYFGREARALLTRQAATPEAVLKALKGKTHWHFASHGFFSWEDARLSALLMHDRAPLSVGKLLETSGLGRPRLVVLSACETGLYDIARNPDEFVGLPSAFVAMGAAGVLGTLWPVSDDATALLIARFYELHLQSGLSPAAALAGAQAWLRNATNEDLSAYARVSAAQGRLENRHLSEIERALTVEALKRSRNRAIVQWVGDDPTKDSQSRSGSSAVSQPLARPYAHPYFWAGFIHTGL